MNRGATLMHYDFRVVTSTTGSRRQPQFTVRAYLKNGRRWAKFPSLANNTRMIVVGKVCGWTSNDRHLAALVDDFKFLGGSDSFLQSGSTQNPLFNKRRARRRESEKESSGGAKKGVTGANSPC
jgi:hypothetical protein